MPIDNTEPTVTNSTYQEAISNLEPDADENCKHISVKGALGVGALAAGVSANVALNTGILNLDPAQHELADHIKGKLGEWSGNAIDYLQSGSKIALVALPVAAIAWPPISKFVSEKRSTPNDEFDLKDSIGNVYRATKTSYRLAWEGIGNTDTKKPGKIRKTIAGTFLASALSVLTANGLMIGETVQSGPNKPLNDIEKEMEASQPDSQAYLISQKGTRHLMNDSEVPLEDVRTLQSEGSRTGMPIAAFGAKLTGFAFGKKEDESFKTGYLMAADQEKNTPSPIMPKVSKDSICVTADDRCVLEPGANQLVVDEHEGMKLGQEVDILGKQFTVVGYTEEGSETSILGRLTGITDIDSFINTQSGGEKNVYGALALAHSKEELDQILEKTGMAKTDETNDLKDVLKANEEFWRDNGTALVLLLISQTAALASVAWYSSRRVEQEMNKETLGTLRALGARKSDLAAIDYMRTMKTTFGSVLLAPLMIPAVSTVVNAGITGFNSKPSPGQLASGLGVTLAAGALGTVIGAKKMSEITPMEAIKNAP